MAAFFMFCVLELNRSAERLQCLWRYDSSKLFANTF